VNPLTWQEAGDLLTEVDGAQERWVRSQLVFELRPNPDRHAYAAAGEKEFRAKLVVLAGRCLPAGPCPARTALEGYLKEAVRDADLQCLADLSGRDEDRDESDAAGRVTERLRGRLVERLAKGDGR